jgi:hypothetical protein
MKLTLLFLLTIAVFCQSGCATGPSINERSLQKQRDDEASKKSTEFANGLGQ